MLPASVSPLLLKKALSEKASLRVSQRLIESKRSSAICIHGSIAARQAGHCQIGPPRAPAQSARKVLLGCLSKLADQ